MKQKYNVTNYNLSNEWMEILKTKKKDTKYINILINDNFIWNREK